MSTPVSQPALEAGPGAAVGKGEPAPARRRDQSWRQQPQHRPTINAYERDRYQRQQAGTWAPFTETGPVRDHIEQLHDTGMTSEQIARASGVSVSTLTRVLKVTRMTATAAEAVLAVSPAARAVSGPEPDPARQLQSLVADGWTVEQLAAAAGLNERTVWQTINGHTSPSPRTTAAVDRLYEDLQVEDPGDSPAAVRSRLRAERNGWVPTTSPAGLTPQELVDQVAVDRAVHGERVPLQPAEQQAALRRLARHHPDDEIGRRLGVATRTVARHRMSQGLPAYTRVSAGAGPAR